MNVILFTTNVDKKFKELNIPFTLLSLKNNELKDLISIKELYLKYKLNDTNLFQNILKHYNLNIVSNLLIQIENYNLSYYFKQVYSSMNIIVDSEELKIKELLYNLINNDNGKQSYIKERNEIINDNGTDDTNILEKLLSLKIDNTYCISIKERLDRQRSVIRQCNNLGLSFEFIKVKKNKKDPIKGCLESHLLCIKDAIANDYENILIMEDDVLFNNNLFRQLLVQNIRFNIPQDFDMLYLGYNVNDGYKYDNQLLKITSAQCAHCYILNKKVFKYILENVTKEWSTFPEWNLRNVLEKQVNFNCRAIDLFYGKIVNQRRNNSYGIFPLLCHQLDSFSDIENKKVSYTKMLNQKSIMMYARFKCDFETYFINLDKRKDRLDNFNKKYSSIITKYKRFPAIDGSTFDFKKYLSLFDISNFPLNIKNPYHSHEYRAGVLGCSLSHYLIWENIKQNKKLNENDFVLVLEDDIEFSQQFIMKFNNLLDELKNDDKWDTVFLGFTDYKNVNDSKVSDSLIRFSGDKRVNGGGTFAYLIRKKGARKFVEQVKKNKIQQAIDWFMIEQFDNVVCYKATPELIVSKVHNEKSGDKDSDIQNSLQRIIGYKEKLETITEESDLLETIKEPEVVEYNINKDNRYLEVAINNEVYFKNKNNHLFNFKNDILRYYGVIENNRLVQKNIPKMNFHHNISNKVSREFILFYIEDKLHYSLRKIIETYTTKYNVIVFGNQLYNININEVIYIHKHSDNLLNTVIKSFKIKKIFITNINYFLYTQKQENHQIYYIHIENIMNHFKERIYKNNGVDFFKNMYDNIDKLFFFSQTELNYFQKYMNMPMNDTNKFEIMSYTLNQNKIQEKEKLLICYDKHPTQITEFFNHFSKSNQQYKLVLFNDDIKLDNPNIQILPRNEYILNKYLQIGTLFITFETLEYSYYNIMNAIDYVLYRNTINHYKIRQLHSISLMKN